MSGFVGAFVPSEILEHFDFKELKEENGVYRIYMYEKEDPGHYPEELRSKGVEVVKAGYMNPIELQTFPIAGREAFIYLHRRRWKAKGDTKTYQNMYDFAVEGTKSTVAFGAFLKEIGRG